MVMRVTSKMLNEESASSQSSLRYKSRHTMLVLINCCNFVVVFMCFFLCSATTEGNVYKGDLKINKNK